MLDTNTILRAHGIVLEAIIQSVGHLGIDRAVLSRIQAQREPRPAEFDSPNQQMEWEQAESAIDQAYGLVRCALSETKETK